MSKIKELNETKDELLPVSNTKQHHRSGSDDHVLKEPVCINSDHRDSSNLFQEINTKLEIRRASLELDGVHQLQKEALSQTLIYAAKETLSVIRSEDYSKGSEEESELGDRITRIHSKSARRGSQDRRRLANECSQEYLEEHSRVPLNYSDTEVTPQSVSDSFGEKTNQQSKSNSKTRRKGSVKNVMQYTKMAEKKRSIRRKESIILVPIKDVKGLTPQQIEEIKKSFNDLDVNLDGRVSKKELIMGTYRLGMNPTDDEVDEMMRQADKNNDGYIDFNEYVDMMRKNYVTIDIERERMKAAFSLLDNDGDGMLSRQELMDALVTKSSGITIEDVEEILRDADMDGNDHIDFNEFVDSTICAKLF